MELLRAYHSGVMIMETQEPNAVSRDTRVQSYTPPAVVYEAALEVRAGSPLGVPGLDDLTHPS